MKTRITKTVFFALIFLTLNTNALTNFACVQDLNNNGVINFGEKQSCLQAKTQDKYLCPLSTQLCTRNARNIYECPVAGNECMEVNARQVCSPNKCIDLVANPTTKLTPPVVGRSDDGAAARDENGVCMGKISIFTGRNLSCKNSGFTRSCCQSNGGVVLSDSTGNMVTGIAGKTAIRNIFSAISKAYTTYISEISKANSTVASASSTAANEAGKQLVGVDPNTIVVAMAIQVIQDFIACGREDSEAVILRDSGYCTKGRSYCSEEWADGLCVVRSKSYCCFDSMMARDVAVSAREQIKNLDFGTAEHPNCRGLSSKEFSSIDFNKIDFEGYTQRAITKNIKPMTLINTDLQDVAQEYYDQLPVGKGL